MVSLAARLRRRGGLGDRGGRRGMAVAVCRAGRIRRGGVRGRACGRAARGDCHRGRGRWQSQQHPGVTAERCQQGKRLDHCFSLVPGHRPRPPASPCVEAAHEPALVPTVPRPRARAIAASTQCHTWPAGTPAFRLPATGRSGSPVSVGCRRRPDRHGSAARAAYGARSTVAAALTETCRSLVGLPLAGSGVARLPGCRSQAGARSLVTCGTHVPFAEMPGTTGRVAAEVSWRSWRRRCASTCRRVRTRKRRTAWPRESRQATPARDGACCAMASCCSRTEGHCSPMAGRSRLPQQNHR